MMHPPAVSIVLTTCNRGHLLPQTLDSILGQSFQNFELLVCDDNSSDSTREVVAGYLKRDPRVVYLPSTVRLGMPANLNRGLRVSRAEFVANLHDGDIYESTLIEKWYSALRYCDDAAFVFNAYRDLGEWFESGHVMSVPLSACSPGRELIRIYDRRWRFHSPVWGTVMARRAAYQAEGFFDDRYGFVADIDMWLKLAEKFHVAYVDEPIISLPRRDVVPRQVELRKWREHRLFHAMMRASRMRRATSWSSRVGHLVVHDSFVVLDMLFVLATMILGERMMKLLAARFLRRG
jgi:glycosyltransferase involved in cell wall biosynthesis